MSVSRRAGRLFLMLAVSWFLNSTAQPQTSAPTAKKLKIYISVDMEGVAGVVTADQLGPTGFEYERFRQFMTNETLAAVRAAKESGATEIVVSDSHGNGENLLIEEFPKDVHIIRSWPRHGSMMAGVDASFDAALFIGYHASTTNPRGVRAHTFFERALHARGAERKCGHGRGVQRGVCRCAGGTGDFRVGR